MHSRVQPECSTATTEFCCDDILCQRLVWCIGIEPWMCSAMKSAAPHSPAGRRPVCIQSRFMDLMSCSAVAATSSALGPPSASRPAKRWMYSDGSTGLHAVWQMAELD
jgi:hypothetical protein